MKKHKFPKQLFITRHEDNDEVWFVANDTADLCDDGEIVAVYELVSVKKKRVEHTLEDK